MAQPPRLFKAGNAAGVTISRASGAHFFYDRVLYSGRRNAIGYLL
jgi:hypothetical protein